MPVVEAEGLKTFFAPNVDYGELGAIEQSRTEVWINGHMAFLVKYELRPVAKARLHEFCYRLIGYADDYNSTQKRIQRQLPHKLEQIPDWPGEGDTVDYYCTQIQSVKPVKYLNPLAASIEPGTEEAETPTYLDTTPDYSGYYIEALFEMLPYKVAKADTISGEFGRFVDPPKVTIADSVLNVKLTQQNIAWGNVAPPAMPPIISRVGDKIAGDVYVIEDRATMTLFWRDVPNNGAFIEDRLKEWRGSVNNSISFYNHSLESCLYQNYQKIERKNIYGKQTFDFEFIFSIYGPGWNSSLNKALYNQPIEYLADHSYPDTHAGTPLLSKKVYPPRDLFKLFEGL